MRVCVATLSLLLGLASTASSQWFGTSNWVDFTEETGTRLVLSSVPLNDSQEKDMVKGDFDQDGDPDVAICRKIPFSVAGGLGNVLLMNENGVLTERTATLAPDLLTADDSRDILAFDSNNDGWVDLCHANTFGEQPRLFLNLGESGGVWQGFAEDTGWLTANLGPPGPKFCAVYEGDVDNDGDLDLYFSDYENSLEDVLLINNIVTGKYTDESATRFPTGINNTVFGTGSFICDFTMDGWDDILKVSGSFEPMKLLVNAGAGNPGVFTVSQTLPSTTVYMARARDFNNDGRTDIYTVSDGQDYLLRNDSTGGGGINTTQTFNVNSNRTLNFGGNVHAGDLDRDGFLDMGVADVDVDIPGCSRRFAALQNRLPANSGFIDPNNSTTLPWNKQGTHDFAFMDINGDGFEDIFMATCTTYHVYIMEPFAVATPYGTGCSGINGVPVAGSAKEPQIGSTSFVLTLTDAAPFVTPFMMISPFQDSVIAAGGCEVLIDLSTLFLFPGQMTNASGDLNLTAPIPNSPALEDVRVFLQWAIPDATGTFLGGFSLSNGVDIYVSSNIL
jgi:hypothetical protein